MKVFLNTDGGSRGNPGHAATGIVIKDESNKIIKQIGTYLGIGTNNEAEYKALIEGLENCINLKTMEVVCRLDSELVVKQVNGLYKVKEPKLQLLHKKVLDLKENFKKVSFIYIPRIQNKEADLIVNQTLDEKDAQNLHRA